MPLITQTVPFIANIMLAVLILAGISSSTNVSSILTLVALFSFTCSLLTSLFFRSHCFWLSPTPILAMAVVIASQDYTNNIGEIYLALSVALVVAIIVMAVSNAYKLVSKLASIRKLYISAYGIFLCFQLWAYAQISIFETTVLFFDFKSLSDLAALKVTAFPRLDFYLVLLLLPLAFVLVTEQYFFSNNRSEAIAASSILLLTTFLAVFIPLIPLSRFPNVSSRPSKVHWLIVGLFIGLVFLLSMQFFPLSFSALLFIASIVWASFVIYLFYKTGLKNRQGVITLGALALALFLSEYISVTGWLIESFELVLEYLPVVCVITYLWLAFIFKAR